MKISFENINAFCRTCLAEFDSQENPNAVVVKHNVYDVHLLQCIVSCTALTVNESDSLPKYICQLCYNNLRSFYEFRELSVRSWRVLRDILGAEGKLKYNKSKNWDQDNPLEFEVVGDENLSNYNVENISQLRTEDFTEFNAKDTKPTSENYLVSEPTDKNLDLQDSVQLSEWAERDASKDDNSEVEIENSDEQTKGTDKKCRVLAQGRSGINERPRRTIIERKKCESLPPKKFELKFQCEHCPRRCINEENLEAHKRTHLGLKPFQCVQCERSFNRSCRLTAHMRETHGETQLKIVCEYEGCGKVFRRDGSYKMHYRLKHTTFKPQQKTWICEDCGRTFKNHTRLKEHRYKHTPIDEYPFKCELCGKRYTALRNYKEHLLRHSGIKNFECPYCGMKKTTSNELRTHINYHTKEKQWPCPHCPSVFNSSANLGMHDRIVHKGIRRYACRFCDQSFGKSDTLKHHEMRHTGERPHECTLCNKSFIQVVALRAHMKTHGKMGKPQRLAEDDQAP